MRFGASSISPGCSTSWTMTSGPTSKSAAARCDLERLCHGADGRMAADLVLQAPQEADGMKSIRLTPLFFRRIHKWVGLILGLQFLLWALSGAVMADGKSTRLNSSH